MSLDSLAQDRATRDSTHLDSTIDPVYNGYLNGDDPELLSANIKDLWRLYLDFKHVSKKRSNWISGRKYDVVKRLQSGKERLPSSRLCQQFCALCRHEMNTRWGALCFIQCKDGGSVFEACLTLIAIQVNNKP